MESIKSRERPSMDHALRVLVRIDTQRSEACLEVRGCLTSATCSTLMNILSHTGTLGAAVRVNLLRAAHVERDALDLLRTGAAGAAPGGTPVDIMAPADLPVCRLGSVSPAFLDSRGAGHRPLSNEEALELAFLRRDPGVLSTGPHPGNWSLRRGGR
ncbi:hypothetical protein ACFFON_00505 [Arthrobacter citreus]|uniref:hypothetical protein n=1 Tax=Arthrobacter TaxID=1663 RepID=UPI0012642386|nr:hypothetical protein [Arthrobacter gandavensis]